MLGGVVKSGHFTRAGEGVTRQLVIEIPVVDIHAIDGLAHIVLGKEAVVGRYHGHAGMALRVVHRVGGHGEA